MKRKRTSTQLTIRKTIVIWTTDWWIQWVTMMMLAVMSNKSGENELARTKSYSLVMMTSRVMTRTMSRTTRTRWLSMTTTLTKTPRLWEIEQLLLKSMEVILRSSQTSLTVRTSSLQAVMVSRKLQARQPRLKWPNSRETTLTTVTVITMVSRELSSRHHSSMKPAEKTVIHHIELSPKCLPGKTARFLGLSSVHMLKVSI